MFKLGVGMGFLLVEESSLGDLDVRVEHERIQWVVWVLAGVSSGPFLGPVIVSFARPSGALRCGDLLCQCRLTHQECQSILTGMDVEKLSVNLSSDDPAIGLRAAVNCGYDSVRHYPVSTE